MNHIIWNDEALLGGYSVLWDPIVHPRINTTPLLVTRKTKRPITLNILVTLWPNLGLECDTFSLFHAEFKERPPALSFKIAKFYFDNNLSDQADSFTLNADGDFYERTIAQSDLSLSFDTESDGKQVYQYPLRS